MTTELSVDEQLRLHALNLAVALRQREVRFAGREEVPDLTGECLVDAKRFHEWLAYGEAAQR